LPWFYDIMAAVLFALLSSACIVEQ